MSAVAPHPGVARAVVKASGGVWTVVRGVLLILAMLVWAGGARSDKVDELWRGGATSALPRDQLDRALWLYELGARDKADDLLASWVAVMPEAADLPDGFANLPADPDLLVAILLQHLQRRQSQGLARAAILAGSGPDGRLAGLCCPVGRVQGRARAADVQ